MLSGQGAVGGVGRAGSGEGKGGRQVELGYSLEKMGEWNRKDCGKARHVNTVGLH